MKKKKIIIVVLLILLSIMLTFLGFLVYYESNRIIFKIDDEIHENYKIKLEYEKNLTLTPETIKLTAVRNKKDITNLIKVENININKLGKYKVNFYIEDKKAAIFPVEVTIVDTTPPIISGTTSVSVYENEEIEITLEASDNYDGNISNKIVCEKQLDPKKIGTQTITYSVTDSSNNKTTYNIDVEIKEEIKVEEPKVNIVSNPNDITVLINKNNYLPDSYVPTDLTLIENGHYLRVEAASKLNEMLTATRNNGITVRVVSSYRSKNTQISLYNSYMAKDPYNAPYYSAYPRTSEHELGLAVDLSYDSSLYSDLHLKPLGIWLNENAHLYGFILRYPSDKTNITGYVHEPWHYRYVGVNLATYLKNNNLTLEEYYY